MDKLPPEHKARWFAGAALNSAEQAMASVLSTVLSRLNAFLDTEWNRFYVLIQKLMQKLSVIKICYIFNTSRGRQYEIFYGQFIFTAVLS